MRAALLALLAACPSLLLQGCFGGDSSVSGEGGSRLMKCGDSVPLCGVLTLETGLGTGNYRHNRPVAHGLWPQNGKYGNSQCLRPGTGNAAPPSQLASCYHQEGKSEKELLHFQAHEWEKHGMCSGAANAAAYFQQVCSMAAAPLRLMHGLRIARGGVEAAALALRAAGYHVWDTDRHTGEVQLSVCAGADRQWKLAAPKDFGKFCGDAAASLSPQAATPTAATTVAKAPVAVPATAASCVPNSHGPPCAADADCARLAGCLRCARSGFCTQVPLQSFLSLYSKERPGGAGWLGLDF